MISFIYLFIYLYFFFNGIFFCNFEFYLSLISNICKLLYECYLQSGGRILFQVLYCHKIHTIFCPSTIFNTSSMHWCVSKLISARTAFNWTQQISPTADQQATWLGTLLLFTWGTWLACVTRFRSPTRLPGDRGRSIVTSVTTSPERVPLFTLTEPGKSAWIPPNLYKSATIYLTELF